MAQKDNDKTVFDPQSPAHRGGDSDKTRFDPSSPAHSMPPADDGEKTQRIPPTGDAVSPSAAGSEKTVLSPAPAADGARTGERRHPGESGQQEELTRAAARGGAGGEHGRPRPDRQALSRHVMDEVVGDLFFALGHR